MATNIKRKFENLSELVGAINAPTDMSDTERSSGSGTEPKKSWDNNTNLEQAVTLLESGWSDGASKVTALDTVINATSDGMIEAPALVSDVFGEMVEPASYFAGEPEAFYRPEVIEQEKPIVKIGVPCSIACSADSKSLINRGVAMLSLIESIENNRIDTEVYIVNYCTSGSDSLLYEIKVKASDMPFDKDRLAFICAHPAFFRRIVFALMEHEAPDYRKRNGITRGGGYMYPGTYESADYDILPDYNLNLFDTPEKSMKWVKENAKKAGVTFADDSTEDTEE